MGSIKYLLAQESDYRWGIVTKTVGSQDIPAGAAYPQGEHPQGHMFSPEVGRVLQEFHVVYITRGRGWFISSHCPKRPVQAGDAFILFPGEWHSYAPDPSTGWCESWVGFSGSICEALLDNSFFDIESPVVHVGISETLCFSFAKAFEVARDEKPAYQQQLAGFISLITGTIFAKSKQHPFGNNPHSDKINLARNFMREKLSENLNMEDVAAHVGMGYSMFRKVFRNFTGFSPAQYFLKLKLEKAKDYLSNTDMSCKEIAFHLGFDSASYFNKIFRQSQNMTPMEFRRQLSNYK